MPLHRVIRQPSKNGFNTSILPQELNSVQAERPTEQGIETQKKSWFSREMEGSGIPAWYAAIAFDISKSPDELAEILRGDFKWTGRMGAGTRIEMMTQFDARRYYFWDRYVQDGAWIAKQASLSGIDDNPAYLKLKTPREDRKTGKLIKYETPAGSEARPMLPNFTWDMGLDVAEKCSKKVRAEYSNRFKGSGAMLTEIDSGFWDFVEAHPEIPIVLTEGWKKNCALAARGYPAVALRGVRCFFKGKKDRLDSSIPHKANERLFCSGRKVTFAFDQDEKESTRRDVARALGDIAFWMDKRGCEIWIAEWDGKLGKGIDDVLAQSGIEAFEQAITTVSPYSWWKIQGKLARRFTKKSDVVLNVPNLVEALPHLDLHERGVIAIKSAKKTGKTEALKHLLAEALDVVNLTHRRALGRNLCSRIGLVWIDDADSFDGRLFEDDMFVRRIGLCVDSLMKILYLVDQTEEFDLILDEATQITTHLLTSQTTGKDGFRPLLLKAFEKVIRKARRIFLADADLNDATIDYIMAIRNEEKEGDDVEKPYIIFNSYKPATGKKARFLGEEAMVLGELADAASRGERIFVASDTLARSRRIYQLLTDSGLHGLLINSECVGRPQAQKYLLDPETAQWEYDFIVSSPSLATGVSVDGDWCDQIFGFFSGWSLLPSDAAQFLSRIRNNAPATIWAVNKGRNFSKISRFCDPIRFLGDLKERTDRKAQLTKSQLSTDALDAIDKIDYTNPHYQLFANIEAERNWQQWDFRSTIQALLRSEGWQIIDEIGDKATAECAALLRKANQRRKEILHEAILSAWQLSKQEAEEIKALKEAGAATDDQLASLERYQLEQFYFPVKLTQELLEMDKEGRLRGQIIESKYFHDRTLNLAEKLTAESIEAQICLAGFLSEEKPSYTSWDFSAAKERKEFRILLGMDEFFLDGAEWQGNSPEVQKTAEMARKCSKQVLQILNFTITPKVTDVQIVNQLLEQMGYKCKSRRISIEGEEKRPRIYSLDPERKEFISMVVESQLERWHRQPPEELPEKDFSSVHPPSISSYSQLERGGGQAQTPLEEIDFGGWSLADVEEVIASCRLVSGDEPTIKVLINIAPPGTHDYIRQNLVNFG